MKKLGMIRVFNQDQTINLIKDMLCARAEISMHDATGVVRLCFKDLNERTIQEEILKWLNIPERVEYRETLKYGSTTNGLDR